MNEVGLALFDQVGELQDIVLDLQKRVMQRDERIRELEAELAERG
jgi:hypothetical protein